MNIKQLMRKMRHERFIESYIDALRWESLNAMMMASTTQWNDDVVALLDNNAKLIRKYETRRRWLKV